MAKFTDRVRPDTANAFYTEYKAANTPEKARALFKLLDEGFDPRLALMDVLRGDDGSLMLFLAASLQKDGIAPEIDALLREHIPDVAEREIAVGNAIVIRRLVDRGTSYSFLNQLAEKGVDVIELANGNQGWRRSIVTASGVGPGNKL